MTFCEPGCGTDSSCAACVPSPPGWDAFAAGTGFTGEKKDSLGRRVCYQGGKRVACPKKEAPKTKTPAKARPTVDDLHAEVRAFKPGGDVKALAARLGALTVPQLKELQGRLGAGGGRVKADRVDAVAGKAVALAKEKGAGGAKAGKAPGKAAGPAAKAAGRVIVPAAARDRRPPDELGDAELDAADRELDGFVNNAANLGRLSAGQVTRVYNRRDALRSEKSRRARGESGAANRRAVEQLRAGAAPAGPVSEHGMSAPEVMDGKDVEGVGFRWNPANEKAAALSVLAMRDHWAGYPKLLRESTGRVTFTAQENNRDSYWQEAYNSPGMKSTATGGDGQIVVYGGNTMTPYVFAHEAGHNVAFRLWGSTRPPADSDYGKAQAQEPPVTPYGAKSSAEDFAEAVRLYVERYESTPGFGTGHDRLKKASPLKYAALRRMFGDA